LIFFTSILRIVLFLPQASYTKELKDKSGKPVIDKETGEVKTKTCHGKAYMEDLMCMCLLSNLTTFDKLKPGQIILTCSKRE
jgi:hypothetical protein